MPAKKRDNYLNLRSYSWSLTTYASEDEINTFIFNNLDIIKYYAWIKHNFDNKEPHIHILIVFDYNIMLGTIINKIKSNQNTLGEPLRDKKLAYEYLIHKNHPNKYQYNEDEIISNNKNYFIYDRIKDNNDNCNLKILNLINDILNGYTYRDMIIKYGRDFVIHYKQYREMADLCRSEKKVIMDIDNNLWNTTLNKEVKKDE